MSLSHASNLLTRARKRRAEVDEDYRARAEAHYLYESKRWVGHIRLVLELDDETPLEMTSALADPRWERNLWAFEVDGLHFIVGSYWHGNPGDSVLLAVKVGETDQEPEWPPPHPRSASNTGWAPKGYVAIHSLAQLAEAVDRARADA